MNNLTVDHQKVLERLESDLLDSYDEEFEMEAEDRFMPDLGGEWGKEHADSQECLSSLLAYHQL